MKTFTARSNVFLFLLVAYESTQSTAPRRREWCSSKAECEKKYGFFRIGSEKIDENRPNTEENLRYYGEVAFNSDEDREQQIAECLVLRGANGEISRSELKVMASPTTLLSYKNTNLRGDVRNISEVTWGCFASCDLLKK